MKNFNTRIDQALNIRLSLYAIHLRSTKAEAGAKAMAQGIPAWVTAVPPSVAKEMASSRNEPREPDEVVGDDDYLARAFEEES
ncbi:MAG: hypothetical protein RIS76_345 [Verrucomicrobiota bacterium]|jgi:hypothetical protein